MSHRVSSCLIIPHRVSSCLLNFYLQNVLSTKCPFTKCPFTKCPSMKCLSMKWLSTKSPFTKGPSTKVPSLKCPSRKLFLQNFYLWNVPIHIYYIKTRTKTSIVTKQEGKKLNFLVKRERERGREGERLREREKSRYLWSLLWSKRHSWTRLRFLLHVGFGHYSLLQKNDQLYILC